MALPIFSLFGTILAFVGIILAVVFETLLHKKMIRLRLGIPMRLGLYFDLCAIASYTIASVESPNAASIIYLLTIISPFYMGTLVWFFRKVRVY